MYYLIDQKLKIIFGWSPKCGCSHIKKIFWFLTKNDKNFPIHTKMDYNKLPLRITDYTTLVFSRNPYKRLVSGFLDKYCINGEYRKRWPESESLTFNNFINKLITNNWNIIDYHHFDKQTSASFDDRIISSKIFKIYDIEQIDYRYIESIFSKSIDQNLLNYRGSHAKKIHNSKLETMVYDLDIDLYSQKYDVSLKYFYNTNLLKKIYAFYEKDFVFFNKFDLNYNINII